MRLFNWKKKKTKDFTDFPPIGGLMVSKLITEQGYKPLFMYREKRVMPEDSGWRIFSGYETPEFTDDPNNTGIYNPSTILKLDDSIYDLLLKGVGSVYERKDAKSDWYQVQDFEMQDDYMVEQDITERWRLTINNLFERIQEESGDLLYTTGDKSLRISALKFENKRHEELLTEELEKIENRDQSEFPTTEVFDFSDSEIGRVGYGIRETDGDKYYNVIYAYSIIENHVLLMAFYFDNESDKQWAIETWKNIRVI